MKYENTLIELLVNNIYSDVDISEKQYKEIMKSAMKHSIRILNDLKKENKKKFKSSLENQLTIYEKTYEAIPRKLRNNINTKDYIQGFNDCLKEYEERISFLMASI